MANIFPSAARRKLIRNYKLTEKTKKLFSYCVINEEYGLKMKESLLIYSLPLVLVWLLPLSIIEAQRNADTCSIFPDGTKLRHPEDCSQEIVCKNFISTDGIKCTGSTPFYNKDTHKCESHLTDHSTCDIDCLYWAGEFVADPKSCYGYYYCQDEVLALYGHCPANKHFNQTEQSCVYAAASDCSRSKLNYCAIVKTGVKFKDDSHCGRYFECAVDKKTSLVELKTVYCPSTAMFFNAAKGACEAKASHGCHPTPKDVCIVKKKIKKNYFVGDGVTCQGSFFCADVGKLADENPQWHSCPGNKFFSEAAQECVDPKQILCLKDRCQGSTRKFVTSSTKGCRNYLRCENGVTIKEESCGNLFFDEEKATCTPEIVTYPACYHK